MRKKDRDTLTTFMYGVVTIAVMSEVIKHSDRFERLAWNMWEPEHCYYCGYRYDHPIVRHDDSREYCGW